MGRRKTTLPVALLAWALASTGVLAWLVLRSAGPLRSDVWAADAKTLDRLGQDFGLIALDTGEFLATDEGNWTLNAVSSAFLSYATVLDAIVAPGGFPTGRPLGFSATAMCVAAYGYNLLYSNARDISFPTGHDVAALLVELSRNLSERLSGLSRAGAGIDPLTAIGASNVTAVHDLMTTLWTANLTDYYVIGPIVAQECGI